LRSRNSQALAALRSRNGFSTPSGDKMDQPGTTRHSARSGWSWWYLLFVIQFIASLWVPFYNRLDPTWIGIPFFYWYQMLWVIIGAILTAIVYFTTED
jgi:Protein of unknown function (DUF3311)